MAMLRGVTGEGPVPFPAMVMAMAWDRLERQDRFDSGGCCCCCWNGCCCCCILWSAAQPSLEAASALLLLWTGTGAGEALGAWSEDLPPLEPKDTDLENNDVFFFD